MTEFRILLPERLCAIEPLGLLPAVTRYCGELFPSDAKVTCNQTRVEANIELGEGVTARIVIDVDPIVGNPRATRVGGSFVASGPRLRDSDRPAIDRLATQVSTGLNETIRNHLSAVSARRAGNPDELGL